MQKNLNKLGLSPYFPGNNFLAMKISSLWGNYFFCVEMIAFGMGAVDRGEISPLQNVSK